MVENLWLRNPRLRQYLGYADGISRGWGMGLDLSP
jgi:hypothetical protein